MSPLRLLWLLLLQHLGFAGAALEYILFTHSARMGSNTTIPCKFDVNAVPPAQRTFSVLWLFQDKEIFRYPNNPGALNSRLSLDQDRIKDGIADLYISGVSISDGGLYKCSMVQIPGEKEKEIRLDVHAPPRITITGKNINKTKENVLSCAISGFYPVDIDIKWLRDGKILNNIILEKPQRGPDGMYSVKSLVTIIPTEEDRNRIFSCRIQHESLTAPLQEDFKLEFRDTKNPILYTIVIPVIVIVILMIIIAVAIFWIKRKGKNDHNKVKNPESQQEKLLSSNQQGKNDHNKGKNPENQQEKFLSSIQQGNNDRNKGKNPENEEEKFMPSNQQGNNDHNNGKHSENEEEKLIPSNQQGNNDHNKVKHPENQVENLMLSNQAFIQTSHDFSEGQESHSKPSVNRQDSEYSGLHTVPDNRKSSSDCTASLSDLCSVDPQDISDSTQSLDTQDADSGKRQAAQQPNTAVSQIRQPEGQESHSKPPVNRQDCGQSGLHTEPDNQKSSSDCTASLSDSCSVDPHHILDCTQNGDSGKGQAAQQPNTAVSQTSHDFSEGQETHSKPPVNRQDSGHSGHHTEPDNRKSTTDCTASHSDSRTVDQHDILNRTQNGGSGKRQVAQQPKTAGNQGGLNQAKNTSSEHQSNSGHQRTPLPEHQATKPFMDGSKGHLNAVKDECRGVNVTNIKTIFEGGSPV